MKIKEMETLRIGDMVALSDTYDATVYRVMEKSTTRIGCVLISANHGRASPRWVDIGMLQRASARQIRDPHNQGA